MGNLFPVQPKKAQQKKVGGLLKPVNTTQAEMDTQLVEFVELPKSNLFLAMPASPTADMHVDMFAQLRVHLEASN